MLTGQGFIFVHIPKCGGNSVAISLGRTDTDIPMHLPYKAVAHRGLPGMTFIRNPWHRMVSLYYFLWQSPARHRQRVKPEEIKAMGFKKWLLEGTNWMSNEPQPDGAVYTRQSGRYGADVTYEGLDVVAAETDLAPMQRRPCMWWAEGCKYIGKVETMQADLNRFLMDLGQKPVNLGHVNKTRAKPTRWQDEYDYETVAHVARYFAADIKAGGYTCPL
jgi:hypothetical protein